MEEMYRLEYDRKPFLHSPLDLSCETVPDPLIRETARLAFETGHFGDVYRVKYEPTLYFSVSNGKMEGTVPDLYLEMRNGSPLILEGSGIIIDSMPPEERTDPKEKQKRVMAAYGLDYKVLYGEDYLELQQLYPGYAFTLTTLPNSSLYVAVAA